MMKAVLARSRIRSVILSGGLLAILLGGCASITVPFRHPYHHETNAAEVMQEWHSFSFTDAGVTRPVYERGSGNPVVIVHELPGLTPQTFELGNRLAASGYHVYMPLLFGEAGHRYSGVGHLIATCLKPEFHCVVSSPHPVSGWIASLADDIHAHRTPNAPMAVIGQCFTGTIPIVLLRKPYVVAAVVSQPAMPFRLSGSTGAVDLTSADVEQARTVRVLAMRFDHDALSARGRILHLARLLPDVVIREFPDGGQPLHSVLTDASDKALLEGKTSFEIVRAYLAQQFAASR